MKLRLVVEVVEEVEGTCSAELVNDVVETELEPAEVVLVVLEELDPALTLLDPAELEAELDPLRLDCEPVPELLFVGNKMVFMLPSVDAGLMVFLR